MVRRLALALFLATPGLVLAQDGPGPKGPGGAPETPAQETPAKPSDPAPTEDEAPADPEKIDEGKKLAETEDKLKKTKEEAEDKKKQAEGEVQEKKKGEEDAQLTLTQAKTTAAAAEAEVERLEKELDDAEEARDAAKTAADAEGAGAEAKAKLDSAEAAVNQAQTTLAAAKQRLTDAEAAVEAAEESAEQAAEAREEAAEKEAEVKEEQERLAKLERVVDAAKKAMAKIADRKRGPEFPKEELAVWIKPMNLEELEAEVKLWIDVLRETSKQISYAEIAVKHTEGEEKSAVLEALNKLRDRQTALIDRVELVLKAYEDRGGKAETERQYIAAATGITLDVKDANAFVSVIWGWLTASEGGIRWGINLLWFFGTILGFRLVGSILGRVVERALRSNRLRTSDLLKDFLVNVIRKALVFVGVIVALSMLEVNIGPLVAAMGGASLVLGFALQGTLSNFAAGVMILMYRPYDLGDVVEAGGVKGVVSAMTLVSTTLKTPDNQEFIIPNNSIWGGVITNVTARPKRRVDLVAGIGYEDDVLLAEAVLMEILNNHEKVLDDPAPLVRLNELADSSVNFVVRPWCKTEDYWDVYWDITREIKIRFDAEGISIPFPQTDVHVHQVPAKAGA